MKRLVIFDLDGTLLNTISDLGTAVNHAMKSLGFPIHPLERYPFMVGNGIRRLVERALPEAYRDTATIDRALSAFIDYYTVHCCDATVPYQGINDLLVELQACGVMVAVASNKYQAGTERLIRHFFPSVNWVAVEGQREGRPRKPDPTVVNEIIARAGVSPDEVLQVGDSDVDIMTARAAGTAAIGVDWGFRPVAELQGAGAQHILTAPEQLLELL